MALLRRKSPPTVPLAGGVWLNPRIGKQVSAEAVVDLSALGLDHIESDPDTLRIGPMATLAEVAANRTCQKLANGLLAQTARKDAPLNVRNAATVGGTVVVAPVDSEFVLALLALKAEVVVQSGEIRLWDLAEFLENPAAALNGGIITGIHLALPLKSAGGLARVARTPGDHPIVAAIAVIEKENECRIAVGGMSTRPLVVAINRPQELEGSLSGALRGTEPYSDFRGSADYRQEMGQVLAKRALETALTNWNRG